MYKDWSFEPIAHLIGDALTLREKRAVLTYLLENTSYLRTQISKLKLPKNAHGAISEMTEASMMQLMLTCEDADIVVAIDRLVRDGVISVPMGEIRETVINRWRFGRHGLIAQLGTFGVRVESAVAEIAPLRARRLVEQMYQLNNEQDRDELGWRLREESSDSLEAKLENHLRTKPIRESLKNLVLSRRANVIVANSMLGLDDRYDSDEDLISAVLWKLGFAIDDRNDPHADFWRLHDRMVHQTRLSPAGANSPDREEIRGLSASYFVELENILEDSLAFTSWALMNDHYSSAKPFVYRPQVDRLPALQRLSQTKDDDNGLRLTYSEKNTLFPLIHGFERLRFRLEGMESDRGTYERSKLDVPEWVRAQALEAFPFIHTVPFLDLLPESSDTIQKALREVTQRLNGSGISGARNEWLHGRRTLASLERLREGLDGVREAVQQLEESGFVRQLYVRTRMTVDSDGRTLIVLAHPSGRQVSLHRPSTFAWLRLPGTAVSQYVMKSAYFAEPAEALRFVLEVESPYSQMWSDFPKRPRLERGLSMMGQSAVVGGSLSGSIDDG
jgi:hypothetical protein